MKDRSPADSGRTTRSNRDTDHLPVRGGLRSRLLAAAGVVLIPALAASAQNVEWTLYDLGTLESGTWSRAEGINNFGEVVGVSSADGGDAGPLRAFIWMTYPNLILPAHTKETIHDLNDFSDEMFIMECAYDINDGTQIVGGNWYEDVNDLIGSRAFSLDPIGPSGWAWNNLGWLLPGGDGAIAYALNDEDPPIVVGEFRVEDDEACGETLNSRAASVSLLGVGLAQLGLADNDCATPPCEADEESGARDINNIEFPHATHRTGGWFDDCAANGGQPEIDMDAVNWQGPGLTILREVAPTHTTWGNRVNGVNNLTNSVGWGFDDPPWTRRALFWKVVDATTVPEDLGDATFDCDYPPDSSFPGNNALANAVSNTLANDAIQVVGQDIEQLAALLWTSYDNGENWLVTDLTLATDAINYGFPGGLWEATDINDHGWVVGYGDVDPSTATEFHAFLAVPVGVCDEDFNGDGKVDAADLSELLGHWNEKCNGCIWDLNDDGVVNSADLAILLGNWGPCDPFPYSPSSCP